MCRSSARYVSSGVITDAVNVSQCTGRRQCTCEATKHDLVANCLSCGRIVCQQEGPGECFTCGQLVLNIEERRAMMAEIESRQLAQQLSTKTTNEDVVNEKVGNSLSSGLKDIAASFEINTGLDKAMRHKDRMLEFDRNSSVRTKVIDDENDYFSLESEKWISKDQRKTISSKVAELHENKLKKDRKILIDLVEHSATDYTEPVIKDFDKKIQDLADQTKLKSDYTSVDTSSLIDDKSQQILPNLVYINDKSKSKDQLIKDIKFTKNLVTSYSKLRIQDKEFLEISDEGMCLSVNQPFASLLISGIKRFEGRNWYSPFRGRLWIHSNSKSLNEKRVQEVENMYRYSGVKNLPSSYPLSALVGCVTVTECLPFEEYTKRFADGDTEANYVFVCEDPKQVRDPVPIASGGNRIWKLNKSIHSVALKQIEL